MRVVAFVPDLIDRSRVTGVEPDAEFVDEPAGLAVSAQGADVVLVDLTRKGALESIPTIPCGRIVGFANHTARETLQQAEELGVVAMPRSEFFIRLEELILGFDR